MKQLVLILIPFLLFACNGKATGEKATETTTANDDLTTTEVNKIQTITGKVTVYDNEAGEPENAYIVLDWESRSKIDLSVSDEMVETLSEYRNQIITVEGYVEKTSQWTGAIDILNIISSDSAE